MIQEPHTNLKPEQELEPTYTDPAPEAVKTVRRSFRNLIALIPLTWLSVLLVIPIFILLSISFSEKTLAVHPYLPIFEWVSFDEIVINLKLQNYLEIFNSTLYLRSLMTSVNTAAIATFFCLLLAYPMALFICRAPAKYRPLLLVLVLLPFWTSYLIRVYAWIGLLNTNGFINMFLMWTGLIDAPLPLINNTFAVTVGIVYSYLPFMILPLYVAIEKMDLSMLEAAYDLGCPPWKTFWLVTFPLTLPGVIAGAMTVFIPAVGEFVIPSLLGGSDSLMVGKLLWNEFFRNGDWPQATALALTLLAFLFIPLVALYRYANKLSVQE